MVVFLLLFIFTLHSEEAKINLWLDRDSLQESVPIQANFIITHEAEESVDVNSFRFDQKKISASLLSKKKIGSSLLVEAYQFTLPPLAEGKYHFTGIVARVGGVIVTSSPVDIEVKPIEKERSAAAENSFLEITPIVGKKEGLYPGMELILGYRYRFRGSIVLKEEVIPLIDKNPFEKVGDKIVQDAIEGPFSTRTIIQKFQMTSPGTYPISESRIIGYGYHETYGGQKILVEPRLESTIAPFSIVVLPFPELGKPPFFHGMLGPFSIKAELLSPSTVEEGESMRFQISFLGKEESQTWVAPDLHCIPGFTYLFSFKEGSSKRDKNRFIYEMYPIQVGTFSIPEVIVASFNPTSLKYETLYTEPIPFEVMPKSLVSPIEKIEREKIVMEQKPFVKEGALEKIEPPFLSYLQGILFSKKVGYVGGILALIAFIFICQGGKKDE